MRRLKRMKRFQQQQQLMLRSDRMPELCFSFSREENNTSGSSNSSSKI